MDKQNQPANYVEHMEMGTFLCNIADRLIKEGESLRALAELWHGYGNESEEKHIVAQMGMEISQLGRQLKLVEDQLCSHCQMKTVMEVISINSQPDGK